MKNVFAMLIAAALTLGFGTAALAGSCGGCGGKDHKKEKATCEGYEKGSEECKKACAEKGNKKPAEEKAETPAS